MLRKEISRDSCLDIANIGTEDELNGLIHRISQRLYDDLIDEIIKTKGFEKLFSGIDTNKKLLLLLSGGVDSTTLLYMLKFLNMDFYGLEFFYNNRPTVENEFVEYHCKLLGIPYYRINYPSVDIGGDEIGDLTEIPLNESNLFYYIIAANFARKMKTDYIVSGQILTDWMDDDFYPDASPLFYHRLNAILNQDPACAFVRVLTPLILFTKKRVLDAAYKLGLDISKTWSCTQNQDESCGECVQCKELQSSLSV